MLRAVLLSKRNFPAPGSESPTVVLNSNGKAPPNRPLVPLVPDVPEVPDDPLVPLEPLVPDVPEVPEPSNTEPASINLSTCI